jgi:hypothetical protein
MAQKYLFIAILCVKMSRVKKAYVNYCRYKDLVVLMKNHYRWTSQIAIDTIKLGYNELGYNELGYNELGYNKQT